MTMSFAPSDVRSWAAPKTFPDEWIERWAPVYLSPENNARFQARHVRFETFLLCPVEILAAIQRPRVIVVSDALLPRQRDVQRRLDIERAALEIAEAAIRDMKPESHCADSAWTEKTRHHAWPRHARHRNPPKEA